MKTKKIQKRKKTHQPLSKILLAGAFATSSLFLNLEAINGLESNLSQNNSSGIEEIVNDYPENNRYVNPTPINILNYNINSANEFQTNFGYNLGIRVGFGSSGPNVNLYGAIGLQNQIHNIPNNITIQNNNVLTLSIYSGGQLGTSELSRPIQFDVSLGNYLTLAQGTRNPHNVYIINYNSPSPFKNTFNSSLSWGQFLTYNSAINRNEDGPGVQAQGLLNLRLNDISITYTNDSINPPSFTGLTNRIFNLPNTDAGWTGSLTINTFGLEFGYHSFTGHRENDDFLNQSEEKHPQNYYHKSLNKATNFVQFRGLRLEYLSDGWLQHFVHNTLANYAIYDYEYLRKLNISFGREF